MRALLNAVKMHGAMGADTRAFMRVGTISSYDPGNYCAKVVLQPEGVETGWLPVLSQWIGNGWGLFAPPTPGDLVEVQFHDGDITDGVVGLRFFNDVERPLPVASGEFWLVHKSGAFFKLTNDGKATFDDAHGARVTLNGDGTISSAGTWNHAGSFTATGDVKAGTISLDNHTHGGVQTGGGNTGAPQ